ncbi:MAG: hypothetical protein K2X38_25440 [Gemmataceae bacterium]|nr:hypothetical protein [Gemmataceae bacterium]
MKVRKEIIPSGVFTYLHGKTGQPAKLTVTNKDINRYATDGNAMLAAGLSIPVPLEHQPDAVPMSSAERMAWQTKHNTGWVEKFETENGKLFGVLDIADPDVAKKLPHTIKFVSPHINSFLDGNGRQWNNVITHVALTTRPRITNQTPFPTMAAALSMVGALPNDTPQAAAAHGGVSISKATLLDPHGKPVYPIMFSLATGVKLAAEEVDEIVEGFDRSPSAAALSFSPEDHPRGQPDNAGQFAEDDEPDGDEEVAAVEAPIPEPMADLDGDGDMDGGDLAIEEAIMHLLKVLGHNPPAMNKATFKRDLYECLMSALQDKVSKAETPEEPAPADDMLDTTDAPVVQEQPNMFASLEDIRAKVKDPEQRRLAEWAFRVRAESERDKKRADAASLSLFAVAQRHQDARRERILGSLPKDRRNKVRERLQSSSSGAAFSLSDDGNVIDPLDSMLSLLEDAIPNMPAILVQEPAAFSIQKPPKGGVMSEERHEEIVSRLAGTVR